MKQPLLPTLDDLEERVPDFITDGTISYCRHCGAEKEASAKFYVTHYHECVKPRIEEGKR